MTRRDIRYPSRTEVRTVPCPTCGARPGQKCIGAREKVRESNHQERVTAHEATA